MAQFPETKHRMSNAMSRFGRLIIFCLTLIICQLPAAAVQLWQSDDAEHSLLLNPTVKTTTLITRTFYDPLNTQRRQSTGLGRLRLSLSGRRRYAWNWELAYENRGRITYNKDLGADRGSAFLPAESQPF